MPDIGFSIAVSHKRRCIIHTATPWVRAEKSSYNNVSPFKAYLKKGKRITGYTHCSELGSAIDHIIGGGIVMFSVVNVISPRDATKQHK